MKGKSLGVVNDNYRDGFERTFSKEKPERFCNGCKEIQIILEERPELISGICPDCGKTMNNPEHKTPEEG